MSKATPDALMRLHDKMIDPSRLVLVVAGPVDAKTVLNDEKALLSPLQSKEKPKGDVRKLGPGGMTSCRAHGEARGIPVDGFDSSETMATLAAALAFASDTEHSFVTYTPSMNGGMIVVGRGGNDTGLGTAIDGDNDDDLGRMYSRGIRLATAWIQRLLQDPENDAFTRGMLLAQHSGHEPDAMLTALGQVTKDQFVDAAKSFKGDKCVMVVGRP
jgi:hypothetical protein